MTSKAANEWHGWDIKRMEELHLVDGQPASDKGCLTPHQDRKKGHECSYHWQALERAKKMSDRYKWPPRHEVPEPQPAKDGNWDVEMWILSADATHPCYYPREAHHLVPFESLTCALCTATSGKRKEKEEQKLKELRAGLLKKGYNLNDKVNMAYLPSTPRHARALQLPYHKGRHGTYSTYVELRLKDIFADAQEAIDKHLNGGGKEPDYGGYVKKIKGLSNDLSDAIFNARLPDDRSRGECDTLKALVKRLQAFGEDV